MDDGLNEGLFERTLMEIYDSGKREIAVILHNSPFICYDVSPENARSYFANNRIFLEECKKRGIPIIHFTSGNGLPEIHMDYMVLYATPTGCPDKCGKECKGKPSPMKEIFGLDPDYEIPTFHDWGFPYDQHLVERYFELKPLCYLPHSDSVFDRAFVTGMYANRCHMGTSEIMAPHTKKLIIIPECTLSRDVGGIDKEKYSGIRTQDVKPPSFLELDRFLGEREREKELFETETLQPANPQI